MHKLNTLTVFRGDNRYLRLFSIAPLPGEPEVGAHESEGFLYFFDVNHPFPGMKLGDFDEDSIVVDENGDVVTSDGNVVVKME